MVTGTEEDWRKSIQESQFEKKRKINNGVR